MKIYNIKDAKRFFEKLAKCDGDVEVVNEKGMHISLFDNDRKNLETVAASYAKGKIDELELCFVKPKDSIMMLEYLVAI